MVYLRLRRTYVNNMLTVFQTVSSLDFGRRIPDGPPKLLRYSVLFLNYVELLDTGQHCCSSVATMRAQFHV